MTIEMTVRDVYAVLTDRRGTKRDLGGPTRASLDGEHLSLVFAGPSGLLKGTDWRTLTTYLGKSTIVRKVIGEDGASGDTLSLVQMIRIRLLQGESNG